MGEAIFKKNECLFLNSNKKAMVKQLGGRAGGNTVFDIAHPRSRNRQDLNSDIYVYHKIWYDNRNGLIPDKSHVTVIILSYYDIATHSNNSDYIVQENMLMLASSYFYAGYYLSGD